MSVYGEDFESDPEYQDGAIDFWCVQTAKSFGPDNGEVNLKECSNRERSCYQEY
jgi:hypothetical protein